MAMNNRGLGRGIQALFDSNAEAGNATFPGPFKMVAIGDVLPNPDQPRKTFNAESIQGLAESIKAHGILQPLLVRAAPEEGRFLLIAGERRLRAARAAGLQEVPVIQRELSDQESLIVTLLENLQREDLNPIEEAKGLEALKNAMGASMEELAATLGHPRSTLSNSLRLLALDPEIQAVIADRRLSTSHAKILAGLDSRQAMLDLKDQIISNDMTTRQAADAVAHWNGHGCFPWEEHAPASSHTDKKAIRKTIDPDIARLGNDLAAALNCRAKVSGNADKGKISLSYETSEQLQALLGRLGLNPAP